MPKKRTSSPPSAKLIPSREVDVGKIVAFVFLPVALLLLTIAAIWTSANQRQIANEISVPGVVVKMVERYGPSLENDNSYGATQQVPYYYPVVEFYTPDERLHTVQLSTGNWPPAYEIGEEVTILYNREHPIEARIQSSSSAFDLWFGPVLLGFLGLIFLTIGLSILWFSRSSKG
jgi:hypothetical protein